MKTLVVLAALVAVALAAPTLPQQGSEDIKKLTNLPETFKRERKSVQESSGSDPALAVSTGSSASHISEFGVSGRSFGLKKPIIIKKKPIGYQVYRDSDEVPAESGETCGSQVKVKFCDGKTKLKSSTIEDTNTHVMEEDMKHSISLAKEAIENLQRDLRTVELNPGTQASSWNHGNSESDAELHQDIENAREALEHIHKNFGNFESMSLQATTLKEADMASGTPFTIAKTDEQRLAQWKEAMDTIQKNVEIAKNIEDSFRVAPDGETKLLNSEDLKIENHKQEVSKEADPALRVSEDMTTKQEIKIESENCKADHAKAKSSEKENNKDEAIEDDMISAASTISAKKLKEEQTRQTSQSIEEAKKESLESAHKESNAAIDTMTLNDFFPKNLVSDNMKSVEDTNDKQDKHIVLSENSQGTLAAPKNGMRSVESEDMLTENLGKAAVSTENLGMLETDEEKQIKMKSAEHFNEQSKTNKKKEDKLQSDLQTEQSKQMETTMSAKSAEEVVTKTQELTDNMLQKNMEVADTEKHLADVKMVNNGNLKTQQEILGNDAEEMELQQHQSLFHPEMRTNEDLKNMHQQLMMDPKMRWAGDKNSHLQRESMASANGIHSHTVQHPGHHHHVAHGMKNHHFEVPSGHELRFSDASEFMTQEKSADPEMMAYYMNMRDGSGLVPENRFRWKPTHEAPRTAYGAPAATPASPQSAGAVGVFPNANLGSCGIPLLLSCNPSVVSGSLAKPAPAPYSAPAYRTEDEFMFHTKRDVKKTHETLSNSKHRMPKSNLKTSTVLVAKQ